MKNYSLIPATLIATLLSVPSLVQASPHHPVNHGNITPADAQAMPAPNTLQKKIHGPSGELLATQPGEVELDATTGAANSVANRAAVNRGNITPADARSTPAPNTLQKKVHGPDGELLATQPGEVEVDTMDGAATQPHNRSQSAKIGKLNQQHSAPTYRRLLKGEVNRGKVTPADLRNQSAPITLRKKVKGPHGELLATQPGEVQMQERRRISRR